MRKTLFFITLLISLLSKQTTVQAQVKVNYNYKSQQKLLPSELGTIYMGVNLIAFSQKIKLDSAEADDSYEELRLEMPFNKNSIEKLSVKFSGLTIEQKSALIKTEIITEKTDYGSYEREVKRISVRGIMATGQLYEVSIFYKQGFDLKKYAVEKYGKPGDVYKEGDDYHIYDMQWTKHSADGLTWLIRYHEENRVLQLAGLIPGSEWSVED